MALKFGRTSATTTTKPKQGRTRYTEEQYNANVAAIEAEASRKKDYDASVAKFKTDSDAYYGRNINPKQEAEEGASVMNMSRNKDRQGRVVTGEAAKPMTQAESDKLFDERRRKGESISINDPSVTAKTRELLKAAYHGTDISNADIKKGKNFDTFKQVYGEEFNPIEWEKDSRAGKTDKYAGRSYGIVDDATLGIRGKTPVHPGKYVPKDVKPIDLKTDYVDFNWGKMKPLEVKFGEGELKMPKKEKEKEELSWQAPNLDKRKKASFSRATRITPSRTTSTGRHISTKTGIHNAALFKTDAVSPQRIKYNTEKRQSAAYFSGKTSFGDDITGKNEEELRGLKKETKDYLKHVRKQDGTSRQDVKDARGDLGTIRKATRYAKKGDISVGSVGEKTGVTREGQKSKLRYFTPEFTQIVQEDGKYTRGEGAMYGYKEYQAQEKDKAYRAQTENATNSNTTWDRTLRPNAAAAAPTSSFSSSVVTRGQMKDKFAKDNPTASRKEIRQGVQKEASSNKQLMKDLRETEKKKGMY